MSREILKILRRITHWLLAVGLIVYVVSGFGITDWQTVEPLTFGLIGKALAMQIHNGLEIPFVIVLLVHIYLSLVKRRQKKVEAAEG